MEKLHADPAGHGTFSLVVTILWARRATAGDGELERGSRSTRPSCLRSPSRASWPVSGPSPWRRSQSRSLPASWCSGSCAVA